MITKRLNKKFMIIYIIILLILFIFPTINANIIKSNLINNTINKIDLFKIGLNGQILPIIFDNTYLENNNITSTITKKLQNLCKNDIEIQKFIKTNNFLPWVEIESSGYGFHISKHRIYFSNKTVLWRSVIKYSFFNDTDYTKGRFKGNNDWITITGQQKIRLVGFVGYIYFRPSYLLNRFKTHEIIIHGYTLRIDKLK